MSLPSGYTRIEYIESTGTQYIDTGFKPNNNTRVVLDFEPTAVYSSIVGIFGIRDTKYATAANMFIFWNNGANTFRTDYFGTNKTMTVSTLLARQTVDKDKNLTTIGSVSASNTASTGRCSNNLYLFCTNDAGTANYFAKLKLYSCQIYSNGTLIRDYIPCQTTSGVAGLWDNVNSKFYQNAKTGSFIVGGMPKGKHKTLVNGTAYEVKGGKCLVNGTVYNILKGRTLINGTGVDILFEAEAFTWKLNENIDKPNGELVAEFVCEIRGRLRTYYGMIAEYDANRDAQMLKYYRNKEGSRTDSAYNFRTFKWVNVGYQTITFKQMPSGALLSWLNNNGRRVK